MFLINCHVFVVHSLRTAPQRAHTHTLVWLGMVCITYQLFVAMFWFYTVSVVDDEHSSSRPFLPFWVHVGGSGH